MNTLENNFGVGILATSHYLPQNILSNEELCQSLDGVTPPWIIEKTGIKRRYFVSENENASDMALSAIRTLLKKKQVDIQNIGLIVVASFSQDYLFPPMSAKIHKELNASKTCQIFDVNTNCTGIVTALTLAAERMWFDSNIKFSLVIGVELLSRFTNRNDKDTSIFFGDGASAVLLGRVNKGFGLMGSKFSTDSSTYESVRLVTGGSHSSNFNGEKKDRALFIEQNGLATWKQAITNLPVVMKSLTASLNIDIQKIDFFIFHQANKLLIEYILKKLKIDESKSLINVEEIGNTGSASIGIALDEAFMKGLIKPNSHLLIAGVGAGFNFGASLWHVE
jgi:3-oxoacyl-[acyl-carrier-protein] synthase III